MWLKGNPLQLTRGTKKKILMIQLGDIGDVVLSLNCVRALKEYFASAQIVVAVWAKARELIEECPWADDVISIEKPKSGMGVALMHHFRFIYRLRKSHFDMVVDLRRGTRGAIMARITGAQLRIGYYTAKETFWRNWLFTHLKDFVVDPHCHQSEHYQALLAECGITIPDGYPQIRVTAFNTEKAGALLERNAINDTTPLIALHPFALWSYKEWPIQKCAELAQRLTAEYDLKIVVLGIGSERERAQIIVEQCEGHAANLAGQTDLRVLPALLKRSLLLIGMDSACGHIAAAVGTPCVTIFGPGKADVWSPLGRHNRIVRMPIPCIHCGQKGCDGRGRSKCLDELPLLDVLTAVKQQLQVITMKVPSK